MYYILRIYLNDILGRNNLRIKRSHATRVCNRGMIEPGTGADLG
jgi:hypothetical protein